MSRQYQAPLNVDLPDPVRKQIFAKQHVNAIFANAKRAARQCATQIVVHGLNLDTLDVQSRMSGYLVDKRLRDYAVKLTFEYAQQMRNKRGQR